MIMITRINNERKKIIVIIRNEKKKGIFLPFTASIAVVASLPNLLTAVQVYVPWSSGNTSGIVSVASPVWISYDGLKSLVGLSSRPSRYHLMSSTGDPVTTHRRVSLDPSTAVTGCKGSVNVGGFPLAGKKKKEHFYS